MQKPGLLRQVFASSQSPASSNYGWYVLAQAAHNGCKKKFANQWLIIKLDVSYHLHNNKLNKPSEISFGDKNSLYQGCTKTKILSKEIKLLNLQSICDDKMLFN